jgi:hypothetical protein
MRFTPFAFAGGQEFLIDYIIVGGGARGGTLPNAHGGGSGAVISGSVATYSGDIFNIIVGAGGTVSNINGETSSLQIKSTTTYYSPGGNDGRSGNGFTSGSSVTCGGLEAAGGGGGSAENGVNGFCPASPVQQPGNGGSGSVWLNAIYYGGGGGAGNSRVTGIAVGNGGFGGGGNGGSRTEGGAAIFAQSGSNGFGGGGGGEGSNGGGAGNGGSGSVIIRYPAPQRAYGGNSIIESGSFVYHTFTSNGTLTT